MEAIVLLVDVKGSRQRADRRELPDRIKAALHTANRRAGRFLIGRFDVAKGVDEFSGVLRPGAPLGRIIAGLWEDLHPVALRLAAARGGLDVVPAGKRAGSGSRSARFFDGPAFHVASRVLRTMPPRGALLALRLGDDAHREQLAAMLGTALYIHVLKWTRRQLEAVRALRDGRTQAEAARHLGVTQPTISEAVSGANARALVPALETFVAEVDALAAREVR